MPTNQQLPERELQAAVASKGGEFVPYDENLLERARTQWQFGDWESLARIDRGIGGPRAIAKRISG